MGGAEVQKGDEISFSTVSILNELTRHSFCSGTLIAPNIVLTAAHCINQLDKNSTVGFGLSSMDAKTRVIKSTLIHPDFNEAQLDLEVPTAPPVDIGLIFLKTKAPKTAVPAQIATDPILLNSEVTLAGFGVTQVNPSKGMGQLRSVESIVTEISEVAREFTYGSQVGKSACVGDSGGPVFVRSGEKLLLTGVISRGETVCQETGMNTDIRFYLDWLQPKLHSL